MRPAPIIAARRGFTFIEVICVLLVITFGLMGVIGLVSHGLIVAQRSQGTCTGMITAVTVAEDVRPMLAGEVKGDWQYTPYDMNAPSITGHLTQGFINGYFVKRTETSVPEDIIAKDAGSGKVYMRSASVSVDVFDTLGGALVTSYNTRIVRQRGQQ